MKVIINISNRWLYTIIAIGVLAIISVGVYAYVGPNEIGHDLEDIEPCSNGEILQTSGGAWSCVSAVVDTDTNTQCTVSGNTITCPTGQLIDTDTDTNTNANTACSGTYTYLTGEGACRDVRADGDLYDTDTDTRCDTSGTCSQVCVGSDCRNSWPTHVSEGLYGNCRHRYHGYCTARSPAYCDPPGGGAGSYCTCPSGYLSIWTGSSGSGGTYDSNFYNCYKQ